MIKKILIANRGEIAVRIIKACREMNITSVAVYSSEDKNALHVRIADQACYIGPGPASESYLNVDKIVETAIATKADAVHPGYGFLSENSAFIERLEKENITFIGPSSKSVFMMGSKTEARTLMKSFDVPIVPGTTEPIGDPEEAKKIASEIGYPVMLKASAGGGGKGMRMVEREDELEHAFKLASSEAGKYFGDASVYIEKFIEQPKHIEVQILGDKFGNYIHLFERECSIQRRHQKIIEEAPSASVDPQTREKICEAAINAARACDYYNAGTIEFLMDKNKNFYFLEMNTRLQVEHPVTEMITGIDLVKQQIKIADGGRLEISQSELSIKGHALEVRVYAEDAENNFAPSTGKIIHHRLPSGPGIRVDRGIELLTNVSVFYDPLLSKIITWGSDREEAVARMLRAIGEYQIAGVKTNMELCRWILNRKSFLDASFNINFINEELNPLLPSDWKSDNPDHAGYEKAAAILGALLKEREKKLSARKNECQPDNRWNEE